MKKRRNREASDGSKDKNIQWHYWLMNKVRESGIYFSTVISLGNVNYRDAFIPNGVRPVFKIANKEET